MTVLPFPLRSQPLGEQLRRQGLPGINWWLTALFLIGVLSRWATRSQLVQSWDAGNFVLALSEFDLLRHQPHLPGVFWLLIVLGRGCLLLTGGNGVAALELVNALVSAAALPCGWYLGFRCGGLRTAWWMVALLFSAPVLWYYASQPLSYGVELGWVVAIGCCLWCVAAGDRPFLIPLVLLMATAGGIRPNTPLFLLPLVVVGCLRGWSRGIEPWRFGAGVLLGGGILAAWLAGFLAEAGGLEEFWPLLMLWKGLHTGQAVSEGPLVTGWGLVKTIALTAPAAIALLLLRWQQRGSLAADPWRAWFLGLWILPSCLYLVLVHFTRMGHATTMLPALVLALALRLGATGPRHGWGRWPRDLLLVLLIQCLLFLVAPGHRFASNLREYDREWGRAIEAVRPFDPATTLVVTTGRSPQRAYRLPSVHLSEYDHGEADLQLDQLRERIEVRPPLERVVFIDRALALTPPALPGVRSETLIPDRLQLIEVPVPPGGLSVGRRQVAPLAPANPPGSPPASPTQRPPS